MRCNYDNWTTKVPVKVNDKMQRVLTLMQDGQVRSRADMLREADIDPNPRSSTGFVASEYTDYFLYKKGLIKVVSIKANQKYFQIA
jgi:hypothetical protein